MSLKRKLLLTITVFVLIIVFIVTLLSAGVKYDCKQVNGPHYCSLENTQPRLIERLVSVFPESLQVSLASKLLTVRQDIISTEENNKAVSLAQNIYQELESNSEWNNLPSSLGIVYEKILRLTLSPQQYFTYIPKNPSNNAIVFLHGYGGNFKTYLYLLSSVSEETGSIIIAPSYKSGVWDSESIEFIDQTISDASSKFNFKFEQLTLIGLSNGGLIIPEYLANSKYNYNNVIALSTYLNPNSFNNDEVKIALKDSKLVYIYGAEDSRIAIDESLQTLEFLKDFGIETTNVPIEGEHLILFEEKDLIFSELKKLLN